MTAMRAKREFSIMKGRKTGSVLDFALDQAYRPPHGSSASLGISRRSLSPHRPWQCATSHFRATVGLQDTPDWLAVPAVLSLFNDSVSTARTAYRGFVAEGVNQPSPWTHATSQIFLGGEDFLSWIEQRLHGKHVANVPSAHVHSTRLSPDDVLRHVAATYRVRLGALLDRSHHDAYQTAVYLLRRAANEPLHTVAVRFHVSPSRISKIQQAIERNPLTPEQSQALARCNVKN
jgi:hypothetical protein